MNNKVLPPIFNDVPFKKVKIPYEVQSHIMNDYDSMEFSMVDDKIYWEPTVKKYCNGGISVLGSDKPCVLRANMTSELQNHCYTTITPMMEDWCGQDLEMTMAYGVRNYIKNSVLHPHRDRVETHIISCIIFVDQLSEKNWPLDFWDHNHNHHKVYFEHGEMLFYESLCLHGRIEPFTGEYYRNMYFHWIPKDWDCKRYNLGDLKCKFETPIEFKDYYDQETIMNKKSRIVPKTREVLKK